MKRRTLTKLREEIPENSKKKSDFLIYILVILTAVLSYVNSLNGEFVHDDIPAIVRNSDVTGSTSMQQLFLNDFWGTPMADVNSHKSYRPLTTLSFRINYWLAGLHPWWWHSCNIFLHAACCALVARAAATVARLKRPFAALAALLFAVHPIHTEAVAGIVGRADVLACIFFLSSLLVYHSSKKCVWLSVLLGALSMLAKETGVTVLLLNITFDFYKSWPYIKKSLSSLKIEKRCYRLSIRTVKVFLSLIILICVRLALLQGTMPMFSEQDNPAAFHPSFFVRLMTFCYLAAFNWWLLLCPLTLSHDWQMGSIPLVTSAWDPRNLLTCAALITIVTLACKCVKDVEIQKHTPLAISFLLLVIPFVPASNLLVTVGFVIAERVLYIPSVGSAVMTAYGAQLAWPGRGRGARFAGVLALILLAASAAKASRRCADWKDRAALLRMDLVTLPQNAKLHYNYGNYLRETEQQDVAMKHYKEALRLWPTYASAHNNLGTMVSELDEAEHHFLSAIKHNHYHVNAHYNLGKLYKKSGRTVEATIALEKCIWLQPQFIPAHVELLTLKPEPEKLEILRSLIIMDAGNWEHYILFGDWYRNKGLHRIASKFYLEATKLTFKTKHSKKTTRSDIASVRSAAHSYRSLGQNSKILQLITRWHTWRRGWPSSAAIHLCLREWRLKIEVEGRVQIYSKAVNLTKSTRCINPAQLAVESKSTEDLNKLDTTGTTQHKKYNKDVKNKVENSDNTKMKTCVTRKRDLSISTIIKTTHNKSEIGLKRKNCNGKKKTVTNNSLIKKIGTPIVEEVFMKTY